MPLDFDLTPFIEAGFGVMYLVAIILFVRYAGRLIHPFEKIADFTKEGQSRLEETQRSLATVIEKNTEILTVMHGSITELVNQIIASNTTFTERFDSIVEQVYKHDSYIRAGVIVLDSNMHTVVYSDNALTLLGWEKQHLPSKENPSIPPAMDINGEKLETKDWPAYQALELGVAVKNVPLQIYSHSNKQYHWVLVSAYPCTKCIENGSEWVTVILNKLDSFGRI